MRTRYLLDETRGPDAPPAAGFGPGARPATAPARLPRSARHQLWHLSTPLLQALLLASEWPQRAQLGARREPPRFERSA